MGSSVHSKSVFMASNYHMEWGFIWHGKHGFTPVGIPAASLYIQRKQWSSVVLWLRAGLQGPYNLYVLKIYSEKASSAITCLAVPRLISCHCCRTPNSARMASRRWCKSRAELCSLTLLNYQRTAHCGRGVLRLAYVECLLSICPIYALLIELNPSRPTMVERPCDLCGQRSMSTSLGDKSRLLTFLMIC